MFSSAVPVIILLTLATGLFVSHAPLFAALLMGVAALISLIMQNGGLSKSRRRMISAVSGVTIAALGLLFLQWSSSLFLGLLLGSVGWMKLAENTAARDRVVAILAALWFIAVELLRLPQSASLAVVGVTMVCLVWALRKGTNFPNVGAIRALLPTCGMLAGLTAILFVFTPRITGDLGMLSFAFDLPFIIETTTEAARKPQENGMSLDGLNQNSDGDMRVLVAQFSKGSGRFENGTAALGDMYWRGPVLWTYSDGNWAAREGWDKRATRMRTKLNRAKMDRELRKAGNMAIYDLSVFPHRGEWLYAMDLSSYAPPSAYVTRDWQLMNLNPVREVLHFSMLSFVDYRAGAQLDAETAALALQLPAHQEPRTQALGRQIAKDLNGDKKAIALRGLDRFTDGYTFDRGTPPMKGANPIDAFLFEDRIGFGLQFATSYAVMMRAAGVPTRVVVGYRGGTHMGLVEKVIVLQRDAHAWTEIWLDDYGWVRMDPAARTVAAQRKGDSSGWGLASGIPEDDQPDLEDDPEDDVAEDETDTAASGSVVTDMQAGAQWLTAFDAKTQGRMLQATGLQANWKVLITTGVLLGFVSGGLIAGWRYFGRKRRQWMMPIPAQIADLFCHHLARYGPARRPNEGLRSFVARIRTSAALDPEEANAISQVSEWLRAAIYKDAIDDFPVEFQSVPKITRLAKQLSYKNSQE